MITLEQLQMIHDEDLVAGRLLRDRGMIADGFCDPIYHNFTCDELLEAIDIVLSIYLTPKQMKEFC